ncbi:MULTISPECIES: hypothetical protein [Bacillaceae]|uniref:hypothetical protein n=1 Tax=Bacillaceae TaxID=186817 RepID=UPI001E3D2AB1|nr:MULTISPECIES: hypothetical protein [Bacillaceae]MCE4050286.1 hypothetical protein [Bacillus sp. Au-Bac7]MCM3029521.1 hypothetical protein [Niallia sp. MER 6]MDL0435173.1 hypothetical protein [Niallia sp. SS-2023]UPO87061.1 hypothetical protein L8T27_016060 [Niallia sp. Man26]
MANKTHELLNGWTLLADRSYKMFANQNSYVLLDEENDVVMQFSVTDQEFEVVSSNWNLNFKIIPAFKTVKILNIPSEE